MNDERVTATMWKNPRDTRQLEFKIIDLESARIFMKDCLLPNSEYTIPDVNNSDMYYFLSKEADSDVVSFSHTRYGEFEFNIMETENVDKRIYKARKSMNNYFFTKDN